MEDDGDICQSVSVENCADEAYRFNMGLPLPFDEPDRAGNAWPLHGDLRGRVAVVRINGAEMQLPMALVMQLLRDRDAESDDDGDGDEDASNPGELAEGQGDEDDEDEGDMEGGIEFGSEPVAEGAEGGVQAFDAIEEEREVAVLAG